MSRALLLSVVFALSAACSSSGNTPHDGGADAAADGPNLTYQRPPVPDGAVLVETDEFNSPAGQDVLMCTFAPIILDHEIDTRELHSYQLAGGHHAAMFYTENVHTGAGANATHPCTEQDMTDIRFVGAGLESLEQALNLPPGLGIRIPAGSQLVVQSHYINTDTVDHRVKDAVVLVPAAPGTIQQLADPLAVTDGDFMLPPHQAYGRTLEYVVDADMNLVMMLGHTHQYGTHLTVQILRSGSTTADTVYDEVAGVRLQNSPPVHTFSDADPMDLHAGDRIHLSCDWNNTTDHVITFPEEMCVTLMYYTPARGFLSGGTVIETRGGTDGGTTGNGNAGCSTPPGPSDPCVRSCNTGNEIGVGRYCTAGGGQCGHNHSAIICTLDGDPTAPIGFCTKPCSSDAGCGSGAVCTGGAGGMGCVPVECVDPGTDMDGGAAPDASSSMDASGG